MNKMKKVFLLALSLAMSATLFAACGKKGNGGGTSSSESSVSTPAGSEESSSSSEDESSSGSETPAVYTFTKVHNPTDRMGGATMTQLEEGADLDLTAPTYPDGKVFKGWFYEDGTAVEAGTKMPAGTLTIYADWEITAYEITVKEDGKDDVVLKFGVESDYRDTENPIIGVQELAFALEGFLPESTEDIVYSFAEEMPATWELKEYTFTIVATEKTYTFTKINGNPRMPGAVTSVELKAGATLDLAAPEAVEGKVFNGWVDGMGEAYTGTTMPKQDVTVYADWTITPYTVTIKMAGADDKVLTFGVESDYRDTENPIIGIEEMPFVIEGEIPADTKTTKYTATGIPEVWALDNYTIEITAEKIDDEDLAGSVTLWDRLNATITDATGATKVNKDNYWDGTEKSVTIGNQKDVTSGSDFANKLTFDYNRYSEEEKAAGKASYSTWKGEMWVGFKVPVGGMDLTKYELVFDMKGENLNPDIITYAVAKGSDDVDYVMGAHTTFKQANMKDLGDGWYRWTITVDCTTAAGKAADYIILSLDNTPDTSKETVVYLDNMSLVEIINYTVTVDGVEQVIRENTVLDLEDPSKTGYEFLGWEDAEGNPVEMPLTVTGDLTLVSTWEKLPLQAQIDDSIAVDLTTMAMERREFEYVQLSAPAGTYAVKVTEGLKTYAIVDGQLGDEITELVLDEEKTVLFAVTYDPENPAVQGSISIICDYTEGLAKYKHVDQYIKDGWGATAPERAWQNGSTATKVTEGIPEGYESVLRLDWYQNSTSLWKAGGNPFYRSCYSQDNISIYQVVRFGLKLETNGDAYIAAQDKRVKFESNQWIFIQLVQTSTQGIWNLTVFDAADNILYSVKNIDRDGAAAGLTDVDSIASLVFSRTGYNGAVTGDVNKWETTHMLALYPCSDASMTASVYMTEVYGYKEDVPFDPAISENATRLWNHTWNNYYFTGGGAPEGAYSTEEAPDGYSYVSEYAFTGNDFPKTGHLNGNDVSDYSDLYFAMKIANGNDIYVQGFDFYTGEGWLYVHLHQEENGRWTKTLRAANGYEATQTNLTGYQYNVNTTDNTFTVVKEYPSLCNLLSYTYSNLVGCGHTGSYPRGNGSTESTAYFTEVLAIRKDGAAITPPAAPGEEPAPEPTPAYDPKISEDAVVIADSVISMTSTNVSVAESDGTAAPAGFDSITQFYASKDTKWSNKILARSDFDSTDITGYSEIWFALMIKNGYLTQTKPSWTDIDGASSTVWIHFHATQNDDATWNLEIVKDGAAWGTLENQTATTLAKLLDDDTDNGRIVLYQPTQVTNTETNEWAPTKDVTIYATKIVGVEKEVVVEPVGPFDPAISEDAIVLWDHIWNPHYFTGGGEPEGAYSDEEAPDGFSKVSYYDFTDRNFPKTGHLNNSTTISSYSDLYFAMKVVNGSDIYLQGCSNAAQGYTGGNWLYVHMYQAADGTWSKDFYAADGFEFKGVQKGLTGTTLPALMTWVSGVNTGSYPRALEGGATTATGYFTEVLAVRKPYDPAISADAVKVYDSIWRADNYALSATTDEAAPTGFTTVKEFNWLNNTVIVDEKINGVATGNKVPYMSQATDFGMTCLSVDMSNLTEFWFAMKQEGGAGFYVRGTSKYAGGQWLYFHGVRADDNTWTLYLNSEDGFEYTQTGIAKEVLKDILSYHAKSETEPWDGGVYPTRNATYWVHKTTFERVDVNPNDKNYVACSDEESYVYFTEVYGIQKTVAAE